VSVVDIHQDRTASVPAIFIEGALLYVSPLLWTPHANLRCRLCFWIPLIYAGIIYHRFRKEVKSYKPVSHPESNIPNQYPVPQSEYPFPSQYQSYAKANIGGEARAISKRPSSSHQGGGSSEPYREHRRSFSDGSRPMTVPIMHVPGHGEAFEMDARGRSP